MGVVPAGPLSTSKMLACDGSTYRRTQTRRKPHRISWGVGSVLAMAGGLTNSSRTAVAGPRAEIMHSQTKSFALRVRFGARPPTERDGQRSGGSCIGRVYRDAVRCRACFSIALSVQHSFCVCALGTKAGKWAPLEPSHRAATSLFTTNPGCQ